MQHHKSRMEPHVGESPALTMLHKGVRGIASVINSMTEIVTAACTHCLDGSAGDAQVQRGREQQRNTERRRYTYTENKQTR